MYERHVTQEDLDFFVNKKKLLEFESSIVEKAQRILLGYRGSYVFDINQQELKDFQSRLGIQIDECNTVLEMLRSEFKPEPFFPGDLNNE